jgi:peptidoglycan-associated lipoprotein
MLRKYRYTLGSLALAALLAGCSSVKLDEGKAPVESRSPSENAAVLAGAGGPGSGTGASQSDVATVDLNRADDPAESGLPRVVYFDFDSFVVKDEFQPVIEAHAKRLAGDRKRRMTLEGHTDDRGGSEYNLALGQKRAEAVLKSMALLGVQDTQLEAVSFGKERPAVQGSSEEAWARNRRVEMKDR